MHFLQRLFHGRNGVDQLNMALAALGFGLNILSRILFESLFTTLAYVALFLCVFRMLSRNIPKRRQENARFLELVRQLRKKAPGAGTSGETFSYLKCPKCEQPIRVPSGKGRIRITCSKCGNQFYESV